MSTSAERWCLKTLKVRFSDPGLLIQALTHRSAVKNHNERLEFLGDAVLNLVIARLLYDANATLTEGELSRARSSLVNREALATLAQAIALAPQIIVGPGEAQNGAFGRSSVLSDALEAVLGAIYLDQGFVAVSTVIESLWREALLKVIAEAPLKDPKSTLQEWAQAQGLSLPVYTHVDTTDNGQEKQFSVTVHIVGVEGVYAGRGSSLKRAERVAAERMLLNLQGRKP